MPYYYGMFREALRGDLFRIRFGITDAANRLGGVIDHKPRRYSDAERTRNLNTITAFATVSLLLVIAGGVIGEWSYGATFKLLGVVLGACVVLWWLFASPGAMKDGPDRAR